MPEVQEIRVDQLPKETTKVILQLLLDELGYSLLVKREWIGAPGNYELVKKGVPRPIVKAKDKAES